MGARTGEEFLKGLKARNREIWLGDERASRTSSTIPPSPALRSSSRRCSIGSTSIPTTA